MGRSGLGFLWGCSQTPPMATVMFRLSGSWRPVLKVVQQPGCPAGAGKLFSLYVELFPRDYLSILTTQWLACPYQYSKIQDRSCNTHMASSRRSDIVSSVAPCWPPRPAHFSVKGTTWRLLKYCEVRFNWDPLQESEEKKHPRPVEICSKVIYNHFHWIQLAKPDYNKVSCALNCGEGHILMVGLPNSHYKGYGHQEENSHGHFCQKSTNILYTN